MITLRIGSKGEAVRELQQALKTVGFYKAAVDADFGFGTAQAVKSFQKARGLKPDGIAGPKTQTALGVGVAKAAPIKAARATESVPAVAAAVKNTAVPELLKRCLALTATLETGDGAPACYAQVSGNFDGQAVSFGALQWNFGQKTLQPLLLELYATELAAVEQALGVAFADRLHELLRGPHAELMGYFIELQRKGAEEDRWTPWKEALQKLGQTPACIAAQERHAVAVYERALDLCREYGLESERAVALMFDVCVQNGAIGKSTRGRILVAFKKCTSEQQRLEVVANFRAEAAAAKWIEDVRVRKLTIARGTGSVHGRDFDLERQFRLTLAKVTALCAERKVS